MSENTAVYIDESTSAQGRIRKALDIAMRYGTIDGAHHKMWVIDQMVRELTGDRYESWVADVSAYDDDGVAAWDDWDTGVAP